MMIDEKISNYDSYRDNKFTHQVYFGKGGAGKLSYRKLFKKFKNYDDTYDRISEASDNNGECYLGKISGHINKSYKMSEQQFLIKNRKNKFSEFCEEN